MRRPALLLLVLSLTMPGQAQTTLQQYYHAGGTAWKNLEPLPSGNLFTGIAPGAGVSIMTSEGEIIHTHSYDVLPFTNLQSVRKHTDNEFYFCHGFLSDSCSVEPQLEVDPVIGKMDSLGNILSLYHYQLNSVTCNNNALDLHITSDHGVLTWGRDESFFVLRVDQNGAPLWSKQFDRNGSFAFVRDLPGGDLLAGFSMDTAGVSLARLNAAGEILWCKSYFRPKGTIRDCVVESDSSFVVTGYTDSIGLPYGLTPLPGDYQPELFMMKVNGAGDVQWCRGYAGEPRWYGVGAVQLERTLDSSYVLLASIGFPDYYIPSRPFLMKTDLNGDTLWTRSVGAFGYAYSIANLLVSPDGGFYYNGSADGDFGQWSGAAFLFKTDSLGHLPCHERTHPVVVIDLFPTDSSFTLTSVEGAVAVASMNSDANYDPITVFDGCTFATGQAPVWRTPQKLTVHPNPNTGRFTVAFNDPLQAESYYSVYDALGKLLFQRPLPVGKGTEEVDLSRYGKGTYVIKCTDPTGVYHERVVVE
jgi:Secretion system C-terminal sorting domain